MRPRFVDSSGRIHVEATKAFYSVVEAVFAGTEIDKWSLTTDGSLAIREILPKLDSFYPHGMNAMIYVADPKKRETLNALFHAVSDAIETAHQAGIERGKSLLVQLAKGGLTTNEFNESVIKGEGKE
jgi:hypothetical protein